MRKMNRIVRYSGLYVLFLGLLLPSGQFAFPGNAYAQVVKVAAPSSGVLQPGRPTRWGGGKVIVVSLSKQWMYAYQDGQEVFETPVTTGRPQLPTPMGIYHIFKKLSPTTFHSSFPRTSRYWYPPTHVQYALEWRAGGYYIHDSWWHTEYGPGTNGWHEDSVYGWQWGSHGCISIPLDAAAWLYQWASLGTTVRVVR